MYPIKEFKKTLDKIDWNEVNKLKDLIKNSNRVFVLGVGGSAANASHAVNDLRKIMGIEAYAPTDNVAEITARTNDDGWKTVFEEYLKCNRIDQNDLILILSVGGGQQIWPMISYSLIGPKEISWNLAKAIDYAKERRTKIAGIVGPNGGYTAEKADVCVKIPAPDELKTPFTEISQSLILHFICLP